MSNTNHTQLMCTTCLDMVYLSIMKLLPQSSYSIYVPPHNDHSFSSFSCMVRGHRTPNIVANFVYIICGCWLYSHCYTLDSQNLFILRSEIFVFVDWHLSTFLPLAPTMSGLVSVLICFTLLESTTGEISQDFPFWDW